jgi:hypothetical protein
MEGRTENPLRLIAALCLAAGLALACEASNIGEADDDGAGDADGDTDADGDGDADADGDSDGDADGDQTGCDKMDILFVVDNSGSMMEEQENLVANFPGFIQALEEYQVGGSGGQLDYHVGVISTGVDHHECAPFIGCTMEEEENGRLQNAPKGNGGDCTPPTLKYIVGPGPHVVNEFSCIAPLGVAGFSEEMPLEAVRRGMTTGPSALDGKDDGHIDDVNAGFLRNDALFVAIIITDEDDQSRANTYPASFQEDAFSAANAAPVSQYVEAYAAIKPSYEYMVFGVISGPASQSCTSDYGGASKAPRLHELIELVGGSNVATANICDQDLAGAFATMLDTIELACDEMPPVY